MLRRSTVCAALVLLTLSAVPAPAATVQCNLYYGGLPLSSTFPTMQSGQVQVRWIDQAKITSYEFTPADSFQISEDLPAGDYRFWFTVTSRTGVTEYQRLSGDLYSSAGQFTIPDQASYTLDVNLQYAVHVTSPLDSLTTWPGAGSDCPYGANQPTTFTLAWTAVPLAVEYDVQVLSYSCGGTYVSQHFLTTGTSQEITQLEAAGEEYISIAVLAHDDRGWTVSTSPFVLHADGIGRYGFTFTTGQQDRVLHSAGQIVPQVAHAPGFGTSFWTSLLILTNPTAQDITTDLYYTPRDANGLTDYETSQVTVPAASCRTIADVVAASFGASGAGALEIVSPDLLVSSRTSTAAPSGGAYGQGMVPITAEQLLTEAGDTARGGGVMRSDGARSNLALNEVWGEPATVTVGLFDRDGAALGSQSVSLLPYSSHQISDLAAALGSLSTLAEGQVVVEYGSGTGRVAATLFLVDGSDDPATVPLYRLP